MTAKRSWAEDLTARRTGTFGATRVAVKWIPTLDLEEEDDLVDLEHDNIVALLHVEDGRKLRFGLVNELQVRLVVIRMFPICSVRSGVSP